MAPVNGELIDDSSGGSSLATDSVGIGVAVGCTTSGWIVAVGATTIVVEVGVCVGSGVGVAGIDVGVAGIGAAVGVTVVVGSVLFAVLSWSVGGEPHAIVAVIVAKITVNTNMLLPVYTITFLLQFIYQSIYSTLKLKKKNTICYTR